MLGLGAAPSNTFKQTNLHVGGIRLSSNNGVVSSSQCQEKYNQLLNTLKAYMIVKEGTIQFAGTFTSPTKDVELMKQIGAATYVEWNSKVQHVQFCCKLTLCRMECLQFHQNVKDVFDTIIKVVSMKWRRRNMGCSIV